MSFGRREREVRGWNEPSTSNADIAAVINCEPRNGNNNNGNSGGGSAVALVALVVVAGLAGMAYGGGSLSFDGFFGGPAPKQTAKAPEHHAKVAEICSTGDAEADYLVSEFESNMLRVRGRVRKPSYLTCMMSKRVERFCDASERKVMALELTTYFNYINNVNANYERVMNDPRSNQMAHVYAKIRQEIDGKEGISSSLSKIRDVDQSVVDMMQQLVRDGYLSEGDFGWALPSYLAPHFEGVTKEKESC